MKRAVKTGDILNSSILITEGLRAGEQVVTSGASFLYDGAPIEVAPDIWPRSKPKEKHSHVKTTLKIKLSPVASPNFLSSTGR